MFFHAYIDHSPGFPNVHFSARARNSVHSCSNEWRSLVFRISQKLPYLFGGLENVLWRHFLWCHTLPAASLAYRAMVALITGTCIPELELVLYTYLQNKKSFSKIRKKCKQIWVNKKQYKKSKKIFELQFPVIT